jgi:hypothetical protein
MDSKLPPRPGRTGEGAGRRASAHAALAAGDWRRGVDIYLELLEAAPDDAEAHAQLAHGFESRHELARATHHARAAIAADPGANIARVALARALLREGDPAGAEEAVAPIVEAEARASANDRSVAWGVIGDARDRAGDAAGAFAAFSAANRIALEQHRRVRDDAAQLFHPAGVAAMTRFLAGEAVSAWRRPSGLHGRAPVFLVGFPRSGTTLLDQILSSHPDIVCLEEKDHFATALTAAFRRPEDLAGMGRLSDSQINAVRLSFWRQAGAIDAPAVVDKMPLNIVLLPLIRAVFPEARVLIALRDPRDAVLSCFQQRFAMNAAMAQMLELDTAAAYYDAVMGLLELSRAKLGLEMHTIRYEDVVADLEGQARAICTFLDRPFDPAMLNYRETALTRDIATPSARQVIQPLYTRSIGRWRRYAEHLAPVLPILAPWAERYGYERA